MEVKIALLVGDNGEWSVARYEDESTDWGFMADCLGVYDEKARTTNYPTSDRQYIITADIDLPKIAIVEASKVEPTP